MKRRKKKAKTESGVAFRGGDRMSRNKDSKKKRILSKALKQNRRVPIFVIAKTARRVMRNVKQRHWRVRKMKMAKRLRAAG